MTGNTQTSKRIPKFKPGDIIRHKSNAWFYSYKILQSDECRYKILRGDNYIGDFNYTYIERNFILLSDNDKIKLL